MGYCPLSKTRLGRVYRSGAVFWRKRDTYADAERIYVGEDLCDLHIDLVMFKLSEAFGGGRSQTLQCLGGEHGFCRLSLSTVPVNIRVVDILDCLSNIYLVSLFVF